IFVLVLLLVFLFVIFICVFFFFFQAEDGIRYLYVTGVQTCALPISPANPSHARADATASSSEISFVEMNPFIEPRTRSVLVRARVSIPWMPGMPFFS